MSNINKPDKLDIDWAELVDLFASEYGWTIDVIKELDMGQIISLSRQIRKRYERQNRAVQDEADLPNQNINNSGEKQMPMSDFITKLGGKMETDKDGNKKIVV